MPGRICAYKSCGTKAGAGITLHAFPNPQIDQNCQKWIEFVNEHPGWQPKATSRLCSLHFRDSEYYIVNGNKRLKPSAIPTVSLDSENEEGDESLEVTESVNSYSQMDISQDFGQNKSTQ